MHLEAGAPSRPPWRGGLQRAPVGARPEGPTGRPPAQPYWSPPAGGFGHFYGHPKGGWRSRENLGPGEFDVLCWVQPAARRTRSPACPRSLARGKLEVKGSQYVWAPAGEARGTRTGARQHGLGSARNVPRGRRWVGWARREPGPRPGGSGEGRGARGGGQARRERAKFLGPVRDT